LYLGVARRPCELAGAGVNVDLLLLVRISEAEFYAVICADDAAAGLV
jgi:hypothetical protein